MSATENAALSTEAKKKIKLAAVQASPIFHNKTATTEKVCALIREAGRNGADVIGFPEAFIPGYPGWVEILPLTRPPANSLFVDLFNQAVEVPGPETEAISRACRDAGCYAVVGVTERRPGTTGTLYNTNLTFGRDGALLLAHQKYTPTVGERLVHAPGTTGSRSAVKTDLGGALSSLICAENGNPLAQYSVGLDYPVVHCAGWPPHFAPGGDTMDAIMPITKGLAFSLGCYVINSVAFVDDAAIEAYGVDDDLRGWLRGEQGRRRATILAPRGVVIAGPNEDGVEGLIYADADADAVIEAKYGMDYVGHYNRPELFAHHFKDL